MTRPDHQLGTARRAVVPVDVHLAPHGMLETHEAPDPWVGGFVIWWAILGLNQ